MNNIMMKGRAKTIKARDHYYWLVANRLAVVEYGCMYLDVSHGLEGYAVRSHRGEVIAITKMMVATRLGCEVEDIDDQVWTHSCNNNGCCNIDHGYVGAKHEPIRVVGTDINTGVRYHYGSLWDADREGFKHRHITTASLGNFNKKRKHSGTDVYKGRRWERY